MAKVKLLYHTVGDCSFSGTSKTECKQKAQEAIEAAFTGEYTPTLLFYRSHTLIVYRTSIGWRYRILYPECIAAAQGTPIGTKAIHFGSKDSYYDVYREGVRHLAQNTWDYGDGLNVPAFIEDKEDRAGQESWQTFQLRYRYFKQQGYEGNTCHQMACDFSNETPPMEELAMHKRPPIGGYSTERILPKT